MRKILLSFLLALLTASLCPGADYSPDKTGSFSMSPRNKKEVRIVANRGYSSSFPENTLISIQKAVETGCDMVMLDVRSTKDNVPVILKDADLDRTTNTVGDIKSKTYQDLTACRAGYTDVFRDAFADEVIPSLEETLLRFGKTRFMLNIYSIHDLPLVRDTLSKCRYQEKNVTLTMNSLEDISSAKGARFRGAVLMRSPLEAYFASENKELWLQNAKKAGADGFAVSYADMFGILNANQRGVFMVQCSKNKLPVYIIGPASAREIQEAMEYQLKGLIGKKRYTGKFTGVITSDPGRAMMIAGRLRASKLQ
ncbi:MAG: hypothetical protein J5758_01510 [Abditibacteriota bacterium]|nr:hypothetical protein [Abditibacteriota bacterium]